MLGAAVAWEPWALAMEIGVSRIAFVWALVAILRQKGLPPELFEGFREPR